MNVAVLRSDSNVVAESSNVNDVAYKALTAGTSTDLPPGTLSGCDVIV